MYCPAPKYFYQSQSHVEAGVRCAALDRACSTFLLCNVNCGFSAKAKQHLSSKNLTSFTQTEIRRPGQPNKAELRNALYILSLH